MARSPSKHPTELELEILKVLWRIGAATVRQVRDELASVRDLAYTSVMTMLSIMAGKGYVTRTKDGRSFVYEATYHETKATKSMLQDVVDRLFGGSTTDGAPPAGNVGPRRRGAETDPFADQPQGSGEIVFWRMGTRARPVFVNKTDGQECPSSVLRVSSTHRRSESLPP